MFRISQRDNVTSMNHPEDSWLWILNKPTSKIVEKMTNTENAAHKSIFICKRKKNTWCLKEYKP